MDHLTMEKIIHAAVAAMSAINQGDMVAVTENGVTAAAVLASAVDAIEAEAHKNMEAA